MKKSVRAVPLGPPHAEDQTVSLAALLDANGTDVRFRQFVQDLLSVAGQIQDVRTTLGKLIGLTGVQYSILISVRHLTRGGDGLTVSNLARHLHMSGTFVTAEVGKLSTLGLVCKEPNPSDRRSVLLQLTPVGQAKLRMLLPAVRRVNDEIFHYLDQAGFQALAPQIAEMANAIGDASLIIEHVQREWDRKASQI